MRGGHPFLSLYKRITTHGRRMRKAKTAPIIITFARLNIQRQNSNKDGELAG